MWMQLHQSELLIQNRGYSENYPQKVHSEGSKLLEDLEANYLTYKNILCLVLGHR